MNKSSARGFTARHLKHSQKKKKQLNDAQVWLPTHQANGKNQAGMFSSKPGTTGAAHKSCPGVSLRGRGNLGRSKIRARPGLGPVGRRAGAGHRQPLVSVQTGLFIFTLSASFHSHKASFPFPGDSF